MPTLEISINPDQLAFAKARLNTAQFRRALATAENKTAASGKTLVSRALALASGAKKTGIDHRLSVFKSSSTNLGAARIRIDGTHGVSLWAFGALETAAGISAKIFGVVKDFPHHFRPRHNPQFARIVFKRLSTRIAPSKGRYAGRVIRRGPHKGQPLLRQQLKSVYGPSMGEVFEKTPGVADEAVKDIQLVLAKNVASQVAWQFEKGTAQSE